MSIVALHQVFCDSNKIGLPPCSGVEPVRGRMVARNALYDALNKGLKSKRYQRRIIHLCPNCAKLAAEQEKLK